MENQLVTTKDETGKSWVSGRSLFRAVSNASNFPNWAGSRAKKMVEGKDFYTTKDFPNPEYGKVRNAYRFLIEYKFSLTAAKRIAILDDSTESLEFLEEYEKKETQTGLLSLNPLSIEIHKVDQVEQTTPASNIQLVGEKSTMTASQKPLLGVFRDPTIGIAISGRELFNLIAKDASRSQRDLFSDWFLERKKKLDLVEGADYVRKHGWYVVFGRKPLIEYFISIESAKRIAKIQQVKRGMGAFWFLENFDGSSLDEAPVQDLATQLELIPEITHNDQSSQSEPLAQNHLPPLQSRFHAKELTEEKPKENKAPAEVNKPNALQEIFDMMQKAANMEAVVEDHELMLTHHTERLDTIEGKMSAIIRLFRDVSTVLFGELTVGSTGPQEELKPEYFAVGITENNLPEGSVRVKIRRLIDGYVEACAIAKKKTTHQEVWSWLYGQLNKQHHYNVSRHKTPKEMYLDAVERDGHLDNLLHIVQTTLVAPTTTT